MTTQLECMYTSFQPASQGMKSRERKPSFFSCLENLIRMKTPGIPLLSIYQEIYSSSHVYRMTLAPAGERERERVRELAAIQSELPPRVYVHLRLDADKVSSSPKLLPPLPQNTKKESIYFLLTASLPVFLIIYEFFLRLARQTRLPPCLSPLRTVPSSSVVS